MHVPDPYSPEPPYVYECAACATRLSADHHPEFCPDCGGQMTDISVPRE